jgi:hypothetical protein
MLRLDRKLVNSLNDNPLVKMSANCSNGVDGENPNVIGSNTLADEVHVDLHVFPALMLHEIGEETDCPDVVAVDEGGTLKGAVKLLEELV